MSLASVGKFAPDPLDMDKGIHELGRLGFRLTQRGRLSASMRCSRETFENTFGTRLKKVQLGYEHDYAFYSFYYPPQGAPWNPSPALTDVIDDAYIQWPHIYMAAKATRPAPRRRARVGGPSVTPPNVDYFHLEMPQEVPMLLNASAVHRRGITGRGIRVAMVDSGFAHRAHPFFETNGFQSTVDLAPHATNDASDLNGHGTGESTNKIGRAHV